MPDPFTPKAHPKEEVPKLSELVKPLLDYLNTKEGEEELKFVLAGAGVGSQAGFAFGQLRTLVANLLDRAEPSMASLFVKSPLAGAAAGGAVTDLLYRGAKANETRQSDETYGRMQPSASGEKQVIGRPLGP